MLPIKLTITDDHPLVLKGLKDLLKGHDEFGIIAECMNGKELLESLKSTVPDILLLDIRMPGTDGIALCAQITREYPDIKVLALTSYEDTAFVKSMLRSGASGYLLKNTNRNMLIEALKTIAAGAQYIQPRLKEKILSETLTGVKTSDYEPLLTRREKEVLGLIAAEHTNEEIAARLSLSIRTVEKHRFNLTHKLGVRNTAGLVKAAIRMGLAD